MYKRIDFTQLEGFPITQNTFEYIQQSFRDTFVGIASLCGDYVIVTGVIDQGSTYSDGWVAYNGELLPFAGGTKAAQIVIEETVTAKQFADGSNKNVWFTRIAKCGVSGGVNVSSFLRLSTLKALVTDLALRAPIASPSFTGTPVAPTAAPGNNTNQIATTAFIQAAIAALVNSSPAALDTLNELASALGNDPNAYNNLLAAIGGRLLKSGDTMSGPLNMGGNKVSNAGNGTNANDLINKSQLDSGLAAKANKVQNAWVNLNLINGWTNAGGSGRPTPSYRIDEFGKIHLRGAVQGPGGLNYVFANNLPDTGSNLVRLGVTQYNSTPSVYASMIEAFSTELNMIVGYGSTSDIILLDDKSYWID